LHFVDWYKVPSPQDAAPFNLWFARSIAPDSKRSTRIICHMSAA